MMQRRDFLASFGALTLVPVQDDRLRDPSAVGRSREPIAEADNDAVIRELELTLKCMCGCNLDIFTCRTTDFTCTYSPALHAEIVALREQGQTPEQITAAFVETHGEQILMAPAPVGFNLAGYLVPGLAVLVAATLLAMLLVRKRDQLPPTLEARVPGPADAPPGPDDLARLERELSEVAD